MRSAGTGIWFMMVMVFLITQSSHGQDPFTTTWSTHDDLTITIPTAGTGYNYDVDWGDSSSVETGFTGDASHTYTTADTFTVTISGEFPRIFFANSSEKGKILSVEQWGDVLWTSMDSAFYGCSHLVLNAIDTPDLSLVTSLHSIFKEAPEVDTDFSGWDVSQVQDMSYMFAGDSLSEGNMASTLAGWFALDNLQSNVPFHAGQTAYCIGISARDSLVARYNWIITDPGLDCSGAFITTWEPFDDKRIAIPCNGEVEDYDFNIDWGDATIILGSGANPTHIYPMQDTFWVMVTGHFPRILFDNGNQSEKILSVEQWGELVWTSMGAAFKGCSRLMVNAIDSPNLSNVVSMVSMFQNASSFNSDISSWDVSSVQNMNFMFANANAFDQDISSWDVSSVTEFGGMFGLAGSFNQDISNWDVSNAYSFDIMFYQASSFNQDIGDWNVSNGVYFFSMFEGATSFDQDLSRWNISNAEEMGGMFKDIQLSTPHYDALLQGWANLPNLPPGLNFDGGNSDYCIGADARDSLLVKHGWSITDGDNDCSNAFDSAFVTSWEITAANPILNIPILGDGYDCGIDWGDGTIEIGQNGQLSHTYTTEDTFTIKIAGLFPRIYINAGGMRDQLLSIEQWGIIQWQSMQDAFEGCSKLVLHAVDRPDLQDVSSMAGMFRRASSFNGEIGHWDLSQVTDLSHMFAFATSFDQNISQWDVSQVTHIDFLFDHASSFNQDLSTWKTTSLTSALGAFNDATSFDQYLGTWDMSNLENLRFIFEDIQLSTLNYDVTLIGWATLDTASGESTIPTGILFEGGLSQYCLSDSLRQILIDVFDWEISDGDLAADCDQGDCADVSIFSGGAWDKAPDMSRSVLIMDDFDTAEHGGFEACTLIVGPDVQFVGQPGQINVYGSP